MDGIDFQPHCIELNSKGYSELFGMICNGLEKISKSCGLDSIRANYSEQNPDIFRILSNENKLKISST